MIYITTIDGLKKISKYVMMDNAHFWKNWNSCILFKVQFKFKHYHRFSKNKKIQWGQCVFKAELLIFRHHNDEAAAMICYLDFNQQSRNKYIFGIIQCISSK